MTVLARALSDLLSAGAREGLFTAGAAGIRIRGERALAVVGRHGLDDPTPTTTSSLFDLASMSKAYTSAAILRLVDDGLIDPEAPVAEILPVGSGPDHARITLRHLLTHAAGFPAKQLLWKDRSLGAEELRDRVRRTRLESAPGALFRYSCVGFIAAGAVAETLTGRPLPELVRTLVTEPLGLTRTGYGPVDSGEAVATEDETYAGRGMVQGSVHDELAWALGGRVGNAGIFAPIDEALAFAESFLDDRLLGARGWRLATTPAPSPNVPGPFAHSFGLRISDPGFLGDVSAIGHTGFTGTMFWVQPEHQVAVTLLTNRVHPRRAGVDLGPFRRRFSEAVARLADAVA
ncbi:serine hydrolase [uncultured Microbacterium sp.]|uniref:serine hydrolase domain-containing protein n=1 Tax=uncultured Microbacterium sp. TaxID=191216 RepID=UPI0025F1F055|nr:serine hydrolase domain-containing protein [uncultured Microbacterium sp.]